MAAGPLTLARPGFAPAPSWLAPVHPGRWIVVPSGGTGCDGCSCFPCFAFLGGGKRGSFFLELGGWTRTTYLGSVASLP
ncbi:uncharacterized protein BO80DRAFT_425700 [Aspergillus ibericus CBS 121593]|uniref:Uncharacterized protein n=1 Tax=Aspergillus ibericus CBS 121593 TaxID=1448316 RepID=A0A395GZM6_9EURO|nr:hypothetical protein BO80DRAFT_425700 [Aspergillus ibericus CBS 121593]RAL00539.1 hypothetical protein BO80DRAFT_425700 [Aspergillus ibericus CBS 121593]